MITFDEKDPPCLNDHLRLLFKKKAIFQKYLKDGRTNNYWPGRSIFGSLRCIPGLAKRIR